MGNAVEGSIGKAIAIKVNVSATIGNFELAVAGEAVQDDDQPACFFGICRPGEESIQHGARGVDAAANTPFDPDFINKRTGAGTHATGEININEYPFFCGCRGVGQGRLAGWTGCGSGGNEGGSRGRVCGCFCGGC